VSRPRIDALVATAAGWLKLANTISQAWRKEIALQLHHSLTRDFCFSD
jgi:hypothetical protein